MRRSSMMVSRSLVSGFALTAVLSVLAACGEDPGDSQGQAGRGSGGSRPGTGGFGAGTGGFGAGSGGFDAGTGGSGAGTGGSATGGSNGFGGTGGSSSGGVGGGSGGVGGTGGSTGGSSGVGGSGGSTGGSGGVGGTGGSTGGTGGSTGGTGGTGGSTGGSGGSTGGTGGSTGGTGGSTGGTGGSTGGTGGSTGGTGGSTGGTGGSTGGTGGSTGGTGGSTGGTGGSTGGTGGSTGGSGGTTVGSGGTGGSSGSPNTAPGFVDLTPPLGTPLDPAGGTTLNPAPPAGWTWYPIAGSQCRDGSPAGIFVRFTTSDKLIMYLEGGGACTNFGFCNYNPQNVNKAISGDGQTVLGSTLGVVDARQQPGVFTFGQLQGIWDNTNAANPFKDWNAVYIPYCTGDVHFGTKANGTVPGVTTPQQFVGHLNMKKFVGRIVPTFKDKVDRVIVTGASAGSFGAALNFSMIQDAFGSVRADAILDSGAPFVDQYMPACMMKRFREAWGMNDALPPDCADCRQADGGGLLKLADFLIGKHPNSTIAVVSSMQDEVIRLFFSVGVKSCANYDTADPVAITTGQILDPTIYYAAADYTAGLNTLRADYLGTGRFATYYIGGFNITYHQHLWRTRFYEQAAGTQTLAQFTTNFLNGQFNQIGP